MSNGLIGGGGVQYIGTTNLAYLDAKGIFKLKLPSQAKGIEYKYIGYEATTGDQYCRPTSRPANRLYCAKKYQNRHFVLQAGIYIHLMRKNVLYKY